VVRLQSAFTLPLTLLVCGSLFSCNSATPQEAAAKAKEASEKALAATGLRAFPVPQSKDADDFGRFLAGLPGRADGPYAKFEKDNAWAVHSKAFAADWAKFEEKRVPVLSNFKKNELGGAPNSGGTLFYPFGGPDFVTANLFFPDNTSYVFLGLEPAGTVRPPSFFEQKPLATLMPRIRLTMESLLIRSFFITDQMDKQVRGQITDGLLPLLLAQMVRTGHTVRGHEYVKLDEKGNYVKRELTDPEKYNKGVIIEFQREGSSEVKRLTYFSVNVHNESLKGNTGLAPFIGQLKPMSSFFKSASYLPHRDDFSTIRDLVLANSSSIAQDDTGIPFRFFDQAKWDVNLYGSYTQPYGTFKYRKQPDLKVAFDKGQNVKNLGFFIGYGYGRAPSNLLVARRRT
jgi:hypothetical protein